MPISAIKAVSIITSTTSLRYGIPIAREMPNSRKRSVTDISTVFMIPKATTTTRMARKRVPPTSSNLMVCSRSGMISRQLSTVRLPSGSCRLRACCTGATRERSVREIATVLMRPYIVSSS